MLTDASANVLGKAYVASPPFPQSTTDADFSLVVPLSQGFTTPPPATPPTQAPFPVPVSGNTINAGVDPQNYFLIGPKTYPANPNNANAATPPYQNPFVSPGLPANIPVLQTDNVTYTPTWNPNVAANPNPPTDERGSGLTVLLRRLANPYLPLQVNPALPYYNPYVTVDYIQNVPLRNNLGLLQNPVVQPTDQSWGKKQPYASLVQPGQGTSPVAIQLPNAAPPGAVTTNGAVSTFGYANFPLPPSGHYDWLVHLDRPAISPMELMHVSAWPPYMLTQRFMMGDNNLATSMFGHYAPWLDAPPGGAAALANMSCPWWYDATLTAGQQSHRLYRLFEFLESGDWATGVNALGRIPGKVNINTVWDPEILRALVDANASIGADDTVVNAIFTNLLALRSPTGTTGATGVSGATDRPFLPLSVGLNPAGTQQFPTNATASPAIGTSVNTDTILRMAPNNQQLLFQNPGDAPLTTHPYWQTQLLTKLYNKVTTRSNTFAVFLTVGFFEVTNAATTPPTLGAEIGRNEGRQIRHRMFAIVDRTNLSVFSVTIEFDRGGPALATPTGNTTITLNSGLAGTVQAGTQLVIEAGTANEETVVIQSVNAMANQVTANFTKQHPNSTVTGNPSGTYTVIQRGNPGPQGRYDPRNDPLVVPYFSLID